MNLGALEDFETFKGFTPTGRTVIFFFFNLRMLSKWPSLQEIKSPFLRPLNKFMKIIMTSAVYALNNGINVIWSFMMNATNMILKRKISKVIPASENFTKPNILVLTTYLNS